MELVELQNLILQKNYPKILLFVGDDYALCNMYIDIIASKLKMSKYLTDDVSGIVFGSRYESLVEDSKLYVVRHNKDIVSNEVLWKDLADKLHSNLLIFVFNSLDKRTKFYNFFKSSIVNFDVQSDDVYVDMLKRGIKLTKDNILKLGKICKNNYGRSLLEIDKVKQYADSRNIDINTAFVELVESNIIFDSDTDVVFQFVNSVLDANKNMYDYYKLLKQQNESNLKIISLLYTAFRNQFIVQTVSRPDVNTTGLNQYIISICLKRQNRYTNNQLRDAMCLLAELERGVKSGRFDEGIIIDYFLAELLL